MDGADAILTMRYAEDTRRITWAEVTPEPWRSGGSQIERTNRPSFQLHELAIRHDDLVHHQKRKQHINATCDEFKIYIPLAKYHKINTTASKRVPSPNLSPKLKARNHDRTIFHHRSSPIIIVSLHQEIRRQAQFATSLLTWRPSKSLIHGLGVICYDCNIASLSHQTLVACVGLPSAIDLKDFHHVFFGIGWDVGC